MPRLFDGPTGDVNTAFIHKAKQLLSSSSSSSPSSSHVFSSSTGGVVTAAVKASPIYGAIVRFAEGAQQHQQGTGSKNIGGGNMSRQQAGGVCVSSSSLVLPLSLNRRGVGLKDPLLQRKMRKQQQQQQDELLSESSPLLMDTDSAHRTCGTDVEGKEQHQVSHWSRRSLQAMTTAGWDVFREQIGIRVEVVSRRAAGQEQQQLHSQSHCPDFQRQPLKCNAETLRPIRCWEEARLPFALGTVVARRYLLPTPIQAQCVPLAMASVASPSGKVDVLGVAETGSGKTAAYLIPLFVDVLRRTPRLIGNDALIAHGPLALVMVPTRELAEQVTREALALVCGIPGTELRKLVREEYTNDDDHDIDNVMAAHNTLDEIRVVKIVGGEQAEAQYNELVKGAHVVVGTLGQLEALLQQRLLALGNTRFVVMDEGDRIIEDHQRDRLIAVLERCPLPRQTIMFTATLSSACEEVALKYFSPDGFVVVRVPYRCSAITQVMELVPSDPCVASKGSEAAAENGQGTSSHKHHHNNYNLHQLEHRRSSLLHPLKFARLVAYLAYATPPVVVFANEKRTCDALYDELRAEATHLSMLSEDFSLETIIGEFPPALRANPHDNYLHLSSPSFSSQQRQLQQRQPAPNLNNMRSIALVHSEQSQAERQRLVELFRRGERCVLVTTDLLSRGLDVPNVTLVMNYDLPRVDTNTSAAVGAGEEAVQKYIHRIGRTGRAGASGVAVSLLCLPSALIQRAQQHVLRSADDNNNAAKHQLQQLSMAGISAKAKVQEFDRRELIGPKNVDDMCENLLKLDDDENEDENDEDEPPRSRQRTERGNVGADGNANGVSQVFPSDEPLLQPFWKFLVGCAETNDKNLNGAQAISQQRCRHVQLPPALVALMVAFTQSSPYGSITT